ncbi:SDR family oxidoreductase [Gluconacetobacter azotocaptans]|uniref:SDR family oxidoreductase n=1 Tax=Gluconacetobacter azotocaptans TaxID=142834 RepID=A0A7W4PFK0_9PROT|nr:SDR family oxidoreductase [Gluconacetobacter azotocaptans]MBB2189001.1 SDR family oxidoreductase [Gluconacetobacter azotocaptans]
MTVSGPIAIVTGGGSGIGRAVALGLAQDGYRVVIAGRRLALLQEVAAEVPTQITPFACDLTQPEEVDALFDTVARDFGRLDLLFNNAGVSGPPCLLEDMSPADWLRVLDINVNGLFYCTQAAFRIMKAQAPQGGRIINNGSISATTPRPNSIAYTAAKHAVAGMTKATALDGRKYRIGCGQIDIGNAQTSMATAMQQGTLQADLSTRPEPMLDLACVVSAIRCMASLPPEAVVQSMTVLPVGMPSFVGRG